MLRPPSMSLPSTSSPSHPAPSSGNRLRLHPTPSSSAAAARNSIINSSAKGWSPLQINKRDGLTSPLKSSPQPSPDPATLTADSPRRSSSSFKHVTKNSLVSNSPFKSPTTVQGQQAAGVYIDTVSTQVVHERRQARPLGVSPDKASGVASTPKAAIGLGIVAKPRSSSRTPSSSGSALNGTRRVSSERKIAFPSTGERKASGGERVVSGSKENDSPDARSAKRTPRSSMGLKGLERNAYVSKSPFKYGSNVDLLDSPSNHSPKSFPIEKDDVFSSPSPRRSSGSKRRASPSKHFISGNDAGSPAPSPPRGVQGLASSSGRPSPLGQTSSSRDITTPTPTPARSSMTPSRRLRGPRDLSEAVNDSPSKLFKTVTFQAVPDVKEFEPLSVEGSADGSFEAAEGWDEGDSLDSTDFNASAEALSKLKIVNPDLSRSPSPEVGPSEDGHNEESTTADFVNTLIEEGLFSPPQMQAHLFEDPPAFATLGDYPPALSTPSLGDSINLGPLLAGTGSVDSAGIPYGRTHHAERNAQAHANVSDPPRVSQPSIPKQSDSRMLLNANASQPSLQYSTPFDHELAHQVHQAGPLPDPFITLQTATKVLLPEQLDKPRSEDGVPLGRTSHHERMASARMLATQSLGIGMPRSPAVQKELSAANTPSTLPTLDHAPRVPSKEKDQSQASSVSHTEESPEDEELYDVSFSSDAQTVEQPVQQHETPRKAPVPQLLNLPTPPSKKDEPTAASQKPKPAEAQKSRFALPNIGFTSPFFSHSTKMQDPPSPGSVSGSEINSDTDDEDIEETSTPLLGRPLTPPPVVGSEKKVESPHRLPSFEFEEISLEAVGKMELKTARVVSPVKKSSSEIGASTPSSSSDGSRVMPGLPVKTLPTSVSAASNRSTATALSASSSAGDFGGPKSDGSNDSTTTRVRQRISREMIRETINQRLADGSLSRRGSTQALVGVKAHYADLAPTPPRPVSIAFPPRHNDKSLAQPISPSLLRQDPFSMGRAHTTDTNIRKVSTMFEDDENEHAPRPGMRPRSQTQSAHQALKATEKDGIIGEPKSALDRIIASNPDSGLNASTSSTSTSILKPAQPPVLASPIRVSSQLGTGVKGREEAINAKRREKEVRIASQGSIGSTGSRKSRRSMSMGDAPDAAKIKQMRKADNDRRLTLGIDRNEPSIVESFNEGSAHIGANRAYKIKEKGVVKASYGPIGHGRSGDMHTGKAWKALRKPSDMNEHATAIREYRAKEASAGKASGTIFVKVLGIENLAVPIPEQRTAFCITLDNGIDYIRTPYSDLAEGARVNQEFSLVEHPNFEFSLSLDIRCDPHILKAIHEKRNPSAASQPSAGLAPPSTAGKPSSGFKALFASPRKPKRPESIIGRPTTPAVAATRQREPTIADFFSTTDIQGTSSQGKATSEAPKIKSYSIAKTHVAFKPIAKQCEAKVLEIRYPMFAMFRGETPTGITPSQSSAQGSTTETRRQVAKITLQVFRLPPLPGLTHAQLPECIDDALRGIRHHAWWECEYHEGVLTQSGGDCSTRPKRRIFKLIGGSLVAINEVTKKQVTSIDLRKVTEIIDLNADDAPLPPPPAITGGRARAGSPTMSRMTMRLRDEDEFESTPRSFRLEFGDTAEGADEGIEFRADKEEDKVMWLQTLRGLIGKIPSNPLWAEMLAARQRERALKKTSSSSSLKKAAARQSSGPAGPMSPTRRGN